MNCLSDNWNKLNKIELLFETEFVTGERVDLWPLNVRYTAVNKKSINAIKTLGYYFIQKKRGGSHCLLFYSGKKSSDNENSWHSEENDFDIRPFTAKRPLNEKNCSQHIVASCVIQPAFGKFKHCHNAHCLRIQTNWPECLKIKSLFFFNLTGGIYLG